jgi:phosphate transport system substrate-binding protein
MLPAAGNAHVNVRRLILGLAGALSLAAILAIVESHDVPQSEALSTSGELTIVGSRSMQEDVGRWVDIYRQRHPDVRVHTMLFGSGTAAGALLEETADVVPLARKLRPMERAMFADRRSTPLIVEVRPESATGARHDDALAVFVHKSNPVPGLTLPQLQAILADDTQYREWRALNLLTSGLSGCPVHAYVVGIPVSIRSLIRDLVLDGGEIRRTIASVPGRDKEAAGRPTAPCAIGFGRLADRPRDTRVVGIARSPNAHFVIPSKATVSTGEYPLAASLYLYVNRDGQRTMNPLAREFLAVALGDEAGTALAQPAYQ